MSTYPQSESNSENVGSPHGGELKFPIADVYLIAKSCLGMLRTAAFEGQVKAEAALHGLALVAEEYLREIPLDYLLKNAKDARPAGQEETIVGLADSASDAKEASKESFSEINKLAEEEARRVAKLTLFKSKNVIRLPDGKELRDWVAGFSRLMDLSQDGLGKAVLENQPEAEKAMYHAALKAVALFQETAADKLVGVSKSLFYWPVLLRADTSQGEIEELLKKLRLGEEAIPRPPSRPPTAPFSRYAREAFNFIKQKLPGTFEPSAELFPNNRPSPSCQKLVDDYESVISRMRKKASEQDNAAEGMGKYLVRIDEEYESLWWEAARIYFDARHPEFEKGDEFQVYARDKPPGKALRTFVIMRIGGEFKKLLPEKR